MADRPRQRVRRAARGTFDPTPYLEHCGQEIRKARKVARLSVDALGEIVGLTEAPIIHLESASGVTGIRTLLHIFAVLGIPLPYPFVPRTPTHLATTEELLARARPGIQEAVHAILVATDPYAEEVPPPLQEECA